MKKYMQNLSIYVNHERGDDYAAQSHYLVTTIANAMQPHIHAIYFFSGKNITDHWYLRKNETRVCNTPLLYCYALGTNQVEYNQASSRNENPGTL